MENVLNCFLKYFLKIRENLKRHNNVYILSSKHTYRPMRARVVAQLFYKFEYICHVTCLDQSRASENI